MKLMKLLILLLLVKLSVSNDTSASTQNVPYPCGRIKLIKVKKTCSFWWRFLCSSYELRFYDLTTTNNTIPGTANNIECKICKLDPHDDSKESCPSQPCNQLEFECIKMSNNVPSAVTATVPQIIDSTATMAITNKFVAQSVGRDQIDPSTLVLGTIIGLLCLLVLLLIAGWSWTCWIMKKKAIRLPRTDNCTGQSQPLNGYATSQVHYENSSLNQNTPQTTKFESSTNYSLLSPENERASGADGGGVSLTNGGEEQYSLLDRASGHGRVKTTASQQMEQLDGYSRLFSN